MTLQPRHVCYWHRHDTWQDSLAMWQECTFDDMQHLEKPSWESSLLSCKHVVWACPAHCNSIVSSQTLTGMLLPGTYLDVTPTLVGIGATSGYRERNPCTGNDTARGYHSTGDNLCFGVGRCKISNNAYPVDIEKSTAVWSINIKFLCESFISASQTQSLGPVCERPGSTRSLLSTTSIDV